MALPVSVITSKTPKEAVLLTRLLAYRFANGDIAHQRGCRYNETLEHRDCSCGLRELNNDIDRWLMQEVNDETV